MIGIVLLVGTAVLLDLRLMGLRLKSVRVWELAGLITMLITGPLLLCLALVILSIS